MTTDFTPWSALSGGALIGVAAVLLMLFNGQIAGVSGIVSRALPPYKGGIPWSAFALVAGLVAAPLLYRLSTGLDVTRLISADLSTLIVGGVLAGFGAGYGNGCTSGHGVCGLSRLSPRSLVATIVFMATAAATVFAVRHSGAFP